MLKSLAYHVIGDQRLHCSSCEQRVVRMLTRLSGIRTARADASQQRIEVLFDPDKLKEAKILECFGLLGYVTEQVAPSNEPATGG